MGHTPIIRVMLGNGSMPRACEENGGRVAALLNELSTGFVVFSNVPLPRPSRAVVDHVVVAPCGLWAILVRAYDEPVTFGEGRGADTLWAGRAPLRISIEECESNAAVLGAALAQPVEPLLCLLAPLPAPAFDFHGLRVANADALSGQLVVATTGLLDVEAVSRRIREVFGVEPSNRSEVPRLSAATAPSSPSRRRARRSRVRVPRRARRAGIARSKLLLVVAVAALVVLVKPGWIGLGTDVAQRGAAQLLSPETTMASPPAVRYVTSCTPDGDLLVDWRWPGRPPVGVAAYGIRTRNGDGAVMNHTLDGWQRAADGPVAARIDQGDVTVITEYRDESGAIIAATERPLYRASLGC